MFRAISWFYLVAFQRQLSEQNPENILTLLFASFPPRHSRDMILKSGFLIDDFLCAKLEQKEIFQLNVFLSFHV